jgi:hypothetical protein
MGWMAADLIGRRVAVISLLGCAAAWPLGTEFSRMKAC